jgi:non-specific serine/threonine protein kinase
VEAVCEDDLCPDVLAGLISLIDKCLVRQVEMPGALPRFAMLGTIREFAWEALAASGEMQQVAHRHASFFLDFVEEAEPALTDRAQAASVARLHPDQENLRAALRYCYQASEVEMGIRLAGALWRYWHATGQLQEGRRWLDKLLARFGGDAAARAKGLASPAGPATRHTEFPVAFAPYQEVRRLDRFA